MHGADLSTIFKGYIACLNRKDFKVLDRFVHEDVERNGESLGLAGYRAMLEDDVSAIPDLYFHVDLLVVDPPLVASRLFFDCTPVGTLFGLPVNGKRISFAENVIYEFRELRIARVWSIIDKAAIEAQL